MDEPSEGSGGLRCFDGRPAPDGLARDLRLLLELPLDARTRLWEVLGPSLPDPPPQNLGGRVEAFARSLGASSEAVARGVRAARLLVRAAVSRDVDASAFAADVCALEGCADIAPLLVPGLDAAAAQLRSEAIRRALLDHGPVLDGVDWRVDEVLRSSQGPAARFSIGVLTLRYTDGDRRERLTLQVTGDELRALRAACTRLLGE
jgi:hypothetical protein